MTTRVEETGATDPDVAWQRYVRPALWPSWSPAIRAVECPDAVIRPGTVGVVHGPVGMRVRFEVTGVDEAARHWEWRVRSGPVALRLRHGVDREPGGARTWLEVEGPGVIAPLYAQVARIALRRLVRP